MEFNSLLFLVFFPVTTLVYFILKGQARLWWLLISGCTFYMAFKPEYIFILAATILIDYFCALKLAEEEGNVRKRWYIASIVFTCLILLVFKYSGMFSNLLISLADLAGIHQPWTFKHLVLPIGLSFHTFQSLSYVSEVYYKRYPPEPNLVRYSTYVMFYPQLVAGPIERPAGLLNQLKSLPKPTFEDIHQGLWLMLWGFFKKVCVADRLAIFADQVFDKPANASGPEALVGILAFAFQIYCDFSGYTDIATGAARVMGFRLCPNFNRPYISKSLGEFWNRWHISLSSWFRDYVYIPLGGQRTHPFRNRMLTFLLSGLWHGAHYTFIFWGGLHGLALSLEKYILPKWKGSTKLYIYPVVVFVLVVFFWVFFRADSFHEATEVLQALSHPWPAKIPFGNGFENTLSFLTMIPLLGVFLTAEYLWGQQPLQRIIKGKSFLFQSFIALLVLFIISSTGVFIRPSVFIYFQF